MAGKLENKIVLITGGSSGIGLSTARLFAQEGAFVYITGRRVEALKIAVEQIGEKAIGMPGDVSKSADLDRWMGQIKAEKGRIDVVIANAAVATYLSVSQVTEPDFDKMFDTNVKGLFFTVQKALPLMPDGGTIVLTGSIAAVKGAPNNSVYSATKAAIRSFARTLTADLKARGIRVNTVSPGATETEGLMNLFNQSGEAGKQRAAMFAQAIPLGRLGQPEELAKAILFMACEDSSYITGAELMVDGGYAQV